MSKHLLSLAIRKLQEQFTELNWTYHDFPVANQSEKMYKWPGKSGDDILICVHKCTGVQELFHRHDFFFFNFTYKGQYDCLSYKYDNHITISEGELYAGQPFAGHALCVHDNEETIIIGVLIQKDAFFHLFLPLLSANSMLFRFFLDPSTNCYSEEFIHFNVSENYNIRSLIEMMVIEYAYPQEDTQTILKPLALAFLMHIARQYAISNPVPNINNPSNKMLQYITEHFDTITLKDIATHFSYHPNYLSTLLKRELGKSFSQIILELRMKRAKMLIKETSLPIEKIAQMLGYSNSSNFYKAYREYYKVTPRECLATE